MPRRELPQVTAQSFLRVWGDNVARNWEEQLKHGLFEKSPETILVDIISTPSKGSTPTRRMKENTRAFIFNFNKFLLRHFAYGTDLSTAKELAHVSRLSLRSPVPPPSLWSRNQGRLKKIPYFYDK